MYKEEAREILKEFLEDCDKTQKTKTKTPLRKAFDLAYSELCKSDSTLCFTQEEIDKVCQAIIDSLVDTSRELQDRVLSILKNNSY
jgi:hypothetical protein|nr:MAG TPA: hypothetical protein [Bacteriophage sp.]